MVKSSGWRRHNSKWLVFNIVALAGALVVITNLIASFTSSVSPSVALTAVQSVNMSAVLHSLSATFVRIEAPDPAHPRSAPQLVLAVEAVDLTDFMDAYKRGFAPEPERYPDDGGIVLHNPELCRGKTLDWVVYVHTSPGHQSRRQLLRDTWANHNLFKHLKFRVVFLLGRHPPESSNLQARDVHLN